MTETSPHRFGHPSPLIFHLGAAAVGYQSAITVAPQLHTPEFPWHLSLRGGVADIGEIDKLKLCTTAAARMAAFISGLEKWQTHPYRRKLVDPPIIWNKGAARLLDYGTDPNAKPVVIIPSLINRAYILDLAENSSLLRYLAASGLRPLLLDWGKPSDIERKFDLDQYASERILPAIHAAQNLCGRDVGLLGYCMGGTLAAGVLSQLDRGIEAFATIGSPWDFSKSRGVSAALREMATAPGAQDTRETLTEIGKTFGMIPTEILQTLFALINPMQAAVKFRKFDAMDTHSPQAFQFAAIEDWLADGVPLPTPTAINLLVDWNIDNVTAKGDWLLMGQTVDLGNIRVPSITICGACDSITPIDVASPMAEAIPGCQLLLPDTGHVGMIVGSKAKAEVWEPLQQFFNTNMRL